MSIPVNERRGKYVNVRLPKPSPPVRGFYHFS